MLLSTLSVALTGALFSQFASSAAIPRSLQQQTNEAIDIILIRNALNLFPTLVDGHEYDRFDEVFAPNATADFDLSSHQIYHSVDEISQGLSILKNITSQHGFTSQYVNVTTPGQAATAVTYLFSNFYGQGHKKNETYQVFGRYNTELRNLEHGWRVTNLTLVEYLTLGDATIPFPNGGD